MKSISRFVKWPEKYFSLRRITSNQADYSGNFSLCLLEPYRMRAA